jgi:hypothetical protein
MSDVDFNKSIQSGLEGNVNAEAFEQGVTFQGMLISLATDLPAK